MQQVILDAGLMKRNVASAGNLRRERAALGASGER